MWLSTKQYAEMFGLHQKTVERLCREGKLEYGEVARVGNLWRIKVEDK